MGFGFAAREGWRGEYRRWVHRTSHPCLLVDARTYDSLSNRKARSGSHAVLDLDLESSPSRYAT